MVRKYGQELLDWLLKNAEVVGLSMFLEVDRGQSKVRACSNIPNAHHRGPTIETKAKAKLYARSTYEASVLLHCGSILSVAISA